MIFESKKEQDELVNDVEQSLKTLGKKKSKNPDSGPQGIGGDIPMDEIRPPSDGHSDSVFDMNISAGNQPKSDGDFVESLENRLLAILEDEIENQTDANRAAAATPAVGMTATLGNTKGNKPAATLAAANRLAVTSYGSGGRVMAGQQDEEQDKEQDKEQKDQSDDRKPEKIKGNEIKPITQGSQTPQAQVSENKAYKKTRRKGRSRKGKRR